METKKLESNFFQLVPFNVAIIDKDHEIIAANKKFENTFGDWHDKKCYESCKLSNKICSYCQAEVVFTTGETCYANESGKDVNGKDYHYVVQFVPIHDDDGKIRHVLEMSVNILQSSAFNHEYNYLFEKVPSYVTVLDKNFKLIKANKKFRDTFGDMRGKTCYEVYKKRSSICKKCPAALTFHSGGDHTSSQIGLTASGEETHYVVNTSPLAYDNNGVSLVIEIATDITEITMLQEQLVESHEFFSELIKHTSEGIIAVNLHDKVQVFNPSARRILDWKSRKKPGISKIKEILPDDFFETFDGDDLISTCKEKNVRNFYGKNIPVMLNSVKILNNKELIGRAAFFSDIRQMKNLEKENIDMQRYASIGKSLEQLKIIGGSMIDKMNRKIEDINYELMKIKNSKLINEIESAKIMFADIAAYINKMLELPRINIENVKILNPIDFFKTFLQNNKGEIEKYQINIVLYETQKFNPIPIDTKQFGLIIMSFLIGLKEISRQQDLNELELTIYLIEEGDILSIDLNTNLRSDQSVMELIKSNLAFINLNVLAASHGGVLNMKDENDKLKFSIILNRHRIKEILNL